MKNCMNCWAKNDVESVLITSLKWLTVAMPIIETIERLTRDKTKIRERLKGRDYRETW